MKKRHLAIVVVIAIAVVAVALVWLYAQNRQDAMEQNAAEETRIASSPSDNTTEETSDNDAPGTYTTYDAETFSSDTSQRILFFHAPWCPQCRQLDSELSAQQDSNTLPQNISIYKIDYDSNQDLRQQYGVTLQTTFIAVDADEGLVRKFVAYDNPTYDSLNQQFLDEL